MWKILELVVLCGLLSPSQGKPFANSVVFRGSEISRVFTAAILQKGNLQNYVTGVLLSNIKSGGSLSCVTGLKVENFRLARHKLVLLPAIVGADISLSVSLDITGHIIKQGVGHNCLIGHVHPDDSKFKSKGSHHWPLVCFSMEMTFRVKYSLANFHNNSFGIIFHECGVEVEAFQVSLSGRTIPTPLLNTIQNLITGGDINRQICAVLKTPYDVAVEYLAGTVNVALSLASDGKMRCLLAKMPIVYDTFAVLDVFIDVEVPGKGNLSIPDSAGCISVPPLLSSNYCQVFHRELINIGLSVLAPKEPQELSCIPDQFSGAKDLKNAILALVPAEFSGGQDLKNAIWGLAPAKSQAHVPMCVLYIRISLEGDPRIVFRVEGAVISVTLRVEFFIKKKDGSTRPILIVRNNMTFSAVLSVVNGRLIFVASVSSNALVLVSSDVGISDVSSLEPHCSRLVKEIFLPVFNSCLAVGIPVLPVYDIVLINPTIQFFEGTLVACM